MRMAKMSVQAVKWALDCAPTTDPAEAAVLIAICERADERGGGGFYSPIAELVKRSRWSRSSVLRALKRLQDRGLVQVVGKSPRGSLRFRVLMTPARCQGDTAAGVTVTPEPSENHQEPQRAYGPRPIKAGLTRTG